MTFREPDEMAPADAPSVGELTRDLKKIIEGKFPEIWVRGEISNLRKQSSGHVYFTLKDAQSQISAVLFRGDALRLRADLRDGMQVVLFGGISVYEPRGTYQIIVRIAVETGVGRLQQKFEELRRKLDAEGLFASEKKKTLPFLPRTIGVITSPTGAAIRDFLRILKRRNFPGRVVIFPARVQGAGAASEIAAMLRKADEMALFDLLVITRGGGSLEDLWQFNEENLVREIARTMAPVISAIGHEIDFTLCDFAADVRAETPSGAAELISSRRLKAVERVENAGKVFANLISQQREKWHRSLELCAARMGQHTPRHVVENFGMRLDALEMRLAQTVSFRFAGNKNSVATLGNRLNAVSVDATLNRGFALVRDDSGALVRSAGGVIPRKKLAIKFADGTAFVRGE